MGTGLINIGYYYLQLVLNRKQSILYVVMDSPVCEIQTDLLYAVV